jgi:hypothetical protein
VKSGRRGTMRRLLLILAAVLCAAWPGSNRSLGGAAIVLAQVASPTATPLRPRARPVRIRPTRPPRLRPPRGSLSSPTPTPTGTPGVRFTPTATPPPATDCEHACSYTISQMRLLWYGGINFSAVIKRGGCAPLTPDPGETGTVQMTKFVTAHHHDTGHDHVASFVMGDHGVGTTSSNGTVQLARVVDSYTFSYSAPVSAFASIRDGANFPVAFNMCLTIGNQAVRMHLVCQGKSQGMLCHKG